MISMWDRWLPVPRQLHQVGVKSAITPTSPHPQPHFVCVCLGGGGGVCVLGWWWWCLWCWCWIDWNNFCVIIIIVTTTGEYCCSLLHNWCCRINNKNKCSYFSLSSAGKHQMWTGEHKIFVHLDLTLSALPSSLSASECHFASAQGHCLGRDIRL